jgi:hypothetical protein
MTAGEPVRDMASRRRCEKASPPTLFGVWLEEDLDRHLCNTGIRRLSCAERPERIAADLIEGTDIVRAVDCACADTLGRKVRMVKDIEVLRP